MAVLSHSSDRRMIQNDCIWKETFIVQLTFLHIMAYMIFDHRVQFRQSNKSMFSST